MKLNADGILFRSKTTKFWSNENMNFCSNLEELLIASAAARICWLFKKQLFAKKSENCMEISNGSVGPSLF